MALKLYMIKVDEEDEFLKMEIISTEQNRIENTQVEYIAENSRI